MDSSKRAGIGQWHEYNHVVCNNEYYWVYIEYYWVYIEYYWVYIEYYWVYIEYYRVYIEYCWVYIYVLLTAVRAIPSYTSPNGAAVRECFEYGIA